MRHLPGDSWHLHKSFHAEIGKSCARRSPFLMCMRQRESDSARAWICWLPHAIECASPLSAPKLPSKATRAVCAPNDGRPGTAKGMLAMDVVLRRGVSEMTPRPCYPRRYFSCFSSSATTNWKLQPAFLLVVTRHTCGKTVALSLLDTTSPDAVAIALLRVNSFWGYCICRAPAYLQ
jgi:hypothetical protein